MCRVIRHQEEYLMRFSRGETVEDTQNDEIMLHAQLVITSYTSSISSVNSVERAANYEKVLLARGMMSARGKRERDRDKKKVSPCSLPD
jgi:hypothetical protein